MNQAELGTIMRNMSFSLTTRQVRPDKVINRIEFEYVTK